MLLFFAIIIPLAVGIALLLFARNMNLTGQFGQTFRISNLEFVISAFVIVGIAVLVTVFVGPSLARQSAINGYNQFYNGSITQARIVPDKCERDGSCAHTYKCDRYTETIYHPPVYDAEGNLIRSGYTETIVKYHSCPYATVELDYVLDDNLGRTIVISSNQFEPNPKEWRRGSGLPGEVPRQVPERWATAKQNLDLGMPDPVTDVRRYANYVLASDNDLYKKFDGYIPKYQELKLLPPHTENIGNGVLYDYGMRANKLQVVGGLELPNVGLWQDRLMRFNAALGSDLQGDLHVVVLPASKVSNPDEYVSTLKAHWTSLGKWSIAKNGIILVLGVSDDATSVVWSRSETGMPFGNGEMRTALNLRLSELAFDPDVIFGNVKASVRKDGKDLEVVYDHSTSGSVGQIIFTDFPFKRACMECKDEGEGVGYVALKDEVPITTGAKVLMFFVVLLLSGALWAGMLYFDLGALMAARSNDDRPVFRRRPRY